MGGCGCAWVGPESRSHSEKKKRIRKSSPKNGLRLYILHQHSGVYYVCKHVRYLVILILSVLTMSAVSF